jgi:4'-phosphopantetheinyl transferase
MPIHRHIKYADADTSIGIWSIEEDEAFFSSQLQLFEDEQHETASLNGRKRLEWFAGRFLLHEMLGATERIHCKKDIFGKPFLNEDHRHISLSHSRDLAAVIVSEQSVGIDIQYLTKKIERIAPKFMSESEFASIADAHRLEQLHVYWGAKESLYKAYGKRALDFRDHIFLDAFDFSPEGGQTTARVQKENFIQHFTVTYRLVERYVLVWCIGEVFASQRASPFSIQTKSIQTSF